MVENADDPLVARPHERLTVAIPMLNPDGAQRRRRGLRRSALRLES
jgi:hypothetical protein